LANTVILSPQLDSSCQLQRLSPGRVSLTFQLTCIDDRFKFIALIARSRCT
jgi:hypothetical protein